MRLIFAIVMIAWAGAATADLYRWIDPETGLTCRDILGGLGSSCSNF